jgi:hypothetical protein
VSHRYQVYLPAKYSRARQAPLEHRRHGRVARLALAALNRALQAFSTDAYRYPERFAATQLPEWATRRAGGQGIA